MQPLCFPLPHLVVILSLVSQIVLVNVTTNDCNESFLFVLFYLFFVLLSFVLVVHKGSICTSNQSSLVNSCSLVTLKSHILLLFPCNSLIMRPLKTPNPVPGRNQVSRFPLWFSASFPNISTKISQIPHLTKWEARR